MSTYSLLASSPVEESSRMRYLSVASNFVQNVLSPPLLVGPRKPCVPAYFCTLRKTGV